jgi:hypothetical protein
LQLTKDRARGPKRSAPRRSAQPSSGTSSSLPQATRPKADAPSDLPDVTGHAEALATSRQSSLPTPPSPSRPALGRHTKSAGVVAPVKQAQDRPSAGVDDPSVSRLIGTEDDTVRDIHPSPRQLTAAAADRPTAMQFAQYLNEERTTEPEHSGARLRPDSGGRTRDVELVEEGEADRRAQVSSVRDAISSWGKPGGRESPRPESDSGGFGAPTSIRPLSTSVSKPNPSPLAPIGRLPRVDVKALLNSRRAEKHSVAAYPASAPLSVEVMYVTSRSASPLDTDSHVFYDTETVAIVVRTKEAADLVSTLLYVWRGAQSDDGRAIESRLKELAKRYRTDMVRSVVSPWCDLRS